MLVPGGIELKVKKVKMKDLYLGLGQGIDLKLAHVYAAALRKSDKDYFAPLDCIKKKDGRYEVKEGHHRFVAYLSLGYKRAWICYYEEKVDL